jgi:hypothetical protein
LAIGVVGDYYSLAVGFSGIGCIITLVALAAFWIGRKGALLS